MALLIGGCPKRQSGPRVVYVPAPSPATSVVPAPDSGTLVIEEPAPPEPETKPVAETPPPAPPPQTRSPKQRRPGAPSEPVAAEQTADEPSLGDVPPLEPANGAKRTGLRQQIEIRQNDDAQRIAQFQRGPLSDAELRTLAEAKAFLDQSTRALKEGDLQRAERLLQKADLLIKAFEERH